MAIQQSLPKCQGAGRLSGLQRGLTSMWLSRVNIAFLNVPFASALRARRGGFTCLQTKSVHLKLCLAGIVKQGRITYSWFRDWWRFGWWWPGGARAREVRDKHTNNLIEAQNTPQPFENFIIKAVSGFLPRYSSLAFFINAVSGFLPRYSSLALFINAVSGLKLTYSSSLWNGWK